jgi:nitrite reductase/ring-hydroxylating ferredoxin subunit
MVMDGEVNGKSSHDDYWIDYGKAEIGSKLIDPPTLGKIVAADNQPRDVPFQIPGDIMPEPRLIPYDRYFDPKYVELEVENIWKKEWQIACREEDIPEIGDRISYDIVNMSFLVVRTGANEFKAFYNSCPHRARKLCEHQGKGDSIQCGFHGWTFGLDT